MKIGYCVEGSTDRALVRGLRDRWCRDATLFEGHFRGSTGQSQKREINQVCFEMSSKGVDLVIFLRDSNSESWRDVLKGFTESCQPRYQHLTIFGVCERNIECWFCADRDWLAGQLGKNGPEFDVPDPKAVFEAALGIRGPEKQEVRIAQLVQHAPLRDWLKASRSFENFYESLRTKSKELGCQLENLRERQV